MSDASDVVSDAVFRRIAPESTGSSLNMHHPPQPRYPRGLLVILIALLLSGFLLTLGPNKKHFSSTWRFYNNNRPHPSKPLPCLFTFYFDIADRKELKLMNQVYKLQYLADRTNGCAYAIVSRDSRPSVCRLSDCDLCILWLNGASYSNSYYWQLWKSYITVMNESIDTKMNRLTLTLV